MNKIILSLLILFCSSAFANQFCKPTLKEYQANPQATFKYRLANDLAFSTIEPKQMLLIAGATIFFDDNHSRYMGYSLQHEQASNTKSVKQALLEALNLVPATADTKLFKGIYKTENCQVLEVKTNNDLYKVYMIPTFTKEPEPYFNVYLIPNDPHKDFVHYLQFKGFSADEVGQQLATMTKGAKQ